MQQTLHAATAGPLLSVVQEELVERHKETLADVSGVKAYLELGDKEHLKILYQLFAIADGLPLLKKNALIAVKQQGEALLAACKRNTSPSSSSSSSSEGSSSSSSNKHFISDLLTTKDIHDAVFADAFAANHEFILGLKVRCKHKKNTWI